MQTHRISAMAAISENRVLGKDNDLVFRIPEDFARNDVISFKSLDRPI